MPDGDGCSDAAFLSALGGSEIFGDLVRLLARGRPVRLDEVAATVGRPVAEVERTPRAQPAVEWDPTGRVLGFGLTLHPTAHRVRVGDQLLYTWCATDTVLVSLALGRPVGVDSTCPASGRTVRFDVDPGGVTGLDPSDAVLSQELCRGPVADVRTDVCDHGHFFASAADATAWTAVHPGGEVISVAGAFARCRRAGAQLGWSAPETAS